MTEVVTRFCRWLRACVDELRWVHRTVQEIRAEAQRDRPAREEW